jgi:hypothetical protein
MNDGIGGTMKSVLWVSWFAMALSGVSCGGAPTPPPAQPPPAPPAAVAAAAPDLSEVPEPKSLVGLLRWKSPEATLATIYAWTGVKLNAAQLASEAIDKSVANAIAFDAPVDAAVALDDHGGDGFAPLAAFAIGVRSIDAARAAAKDLGTISEIAPGEYKINLRHGRRKKDKPFCILAAAVGPAPGRFVCGERERDVESLRAYMTRTLPKRDLGAADLHVEFRVAPVVDNYGELINQGLHMGAALLPRKLQIGEPSFDRAIDRMAAGVSDELGAVVHDLDSMTFDLSMAPDKATSAITLRLKGQSSWSAGNLVSLGSRSAPPPPMFWRLPASTTAAVYGYRPEARRFEAVRNTVSELIDGWLQHDGMAAADRAAIKALFDEKFMVDAPVVAGLGPFADAPAKPAPKGAPAVSSDALQAALAKAGWLVVGVGAPNQIPEYLKAASNAASRPKIQAYFKDKLAAANSNGELNRYQSQSVTGFTLKTAPVPKDLPKGSLAFELTVAHDAPPAETKAGAAPRKKGPAPSVKVELLVVSESAQTWVALGADKAQLAKTVLGVTQQAPESGTLAARQDLAFFRQTKLAEGGFFTLEALLTSFVAPATWVDADVAQNAQGAHSLLASTPNKGKSPIVTTDEIKTGDALTVTIRTEVPKGVIEDAVLLAATSGLGPKPRP